VKHEQSEFDETDTPELRGDQYTVVKHGSCQLLVPHLLPTCTHKMTTTMATMQAIMVLTQATTRGRGRKEPSRRIMTEVELPFTEHPF